MKKYIPVIFVLLSAYSWNAAAQNAGINASGSSPDASAGLDVDFGDKGLLIPRVALASSTDGGTVTSPATSLLVYNTGTGGLTPAGYYYNKGASGAPVWELLLTPGTAWTVTGNAGITSGANFIGTTDNMSLRIRTNNTQRMIVDSIGNVGIGTVAPGSMLDVKGVMRLSGATSGYVGLQAAANAGSATYTLPSTIGGAGTVLTDAAGNGTLSWAVPSGGLPQVMFNNIAWDYTYNRSFYTDNRNVYFGCDFKTIKVGYAGAANQSKLITDTYAAADEVYGSIKLGGYIYVLARDNGTSPDTWQLYRYDYTNLAGGGTLMSFAGGNALAQTDFVMAMGCDGSNLYINYNAGNSANAWVIAKYSLSGTTLTYVDSRTCGSSNAGFSNGFGVNSAGNIYVSDDNVFAMRKYNSTGALQYTEPNYTQSPHIAVRLFVVEDNIYFMSSQGYMVKANYVP